MAPPVKYTPEVRAAIVRHILQEVSSGRSVANVLKRDAGMPASSLFWGWHLDDPQMQSDLAQARVNGVEALLDEIPDIADGTDLERDEDGTLKNPQDAYLLDTQRAKLRVNAREKRAQMIAPRKYGPSLDLTSAGQQLGVPAVPRDDAAEIAELLKTIEQQHGIDVIKDPRALDLLS